MNAKGKFFIRRAKAKKQRENESKKTDDVNEEDIQKIKSFMSMWSLLKRNK